MTRITSRLMGTLITPLSPRSSHDQIFKRIFHTKSFERFSQKNQDNTEIFKERDIVILLEGNSIDGENLIHSQGRPIYILGKLFGRLIGVFLSSQNIDKNSLQLMPDSNNGLTLNSKPIFNQWVSIDPKTQRLEKWGFNDNLLIHKEIIAKTIQQIEKSQKNPSSQGLIYEVNTVGKCFNVFVISNYGLKAPVHIGIKMANPLAIVDQSEPYILNMEWKDHLGHTKSQILDMRDINSYSHETMLPIGKTNEFSFMKIHNETMKIFNERK
ncbi:MAG: hypothetical protein QRY71_01910 [Candidatus Rhabdochlamydia sp.]